MRRSWRQETTCTLVGPDAARSDIDPPSSGLPVEFVGDEERSNAQLRPSGARAQESVGEGGSGGQDARKSTRDACAMSK